MVSSLEKRTLHENYDASLDERAVLAEAVVGLAVVVVLALLGAGYAGDAESGAVFSSRSVVSGR